MNKPRNEMTDEEVEFIFKALDRLAKNGTDIVEVLKSGQGIEHFVNELQKSADKGVH